MTALRRTGPATHLPCGCRFWTALGPRDDAIFVYVPCAPDCEFYRYALDENARQGKPVFKRLP